MSAVHRETEIEVAHRTAGSAVVFQSGTTGGDCLMQNIRNGMSQVFVVCHAQRQNTSIWRQMGRPEDFAGIHIADA